MPFLGENGPDLYLRRTLAKAGYPEIDPSSPKLETARFALDFLQGAAEITLSDECQTFLLRVITDSAFPRNFRTSAAAIAGRCRDTRIAQRLAESDWLATDKGSSPRAIGVGTLLASTVAAPGIYPRLREHIHPAEAGTVLETAHEQDCGLLIADIDRLVRAACATMCQEEGPATTSKPDKSLQGFGLSGVAFSLSEPRRTPAADPERS